MGDAADEPLGHVPTGVGKRGPTDGGELTEVAGAA